MNKINEYKKIIEGMTEEARFYWLNVAVDKNELSKAEAGFLLR